MRKPITVLVVDDNREYCTMLCQLFSMHENVDILPPVHNGVQALRTLEQTQVDVMVLDLVMPEMDGFSVLEQIREKKIDVTVVINSAVHIDTLTSRAMDLGAAYYFIKPTELELIVHRVLQMMSSIGEDGPSTAYAKSSDAWREAKEAPRKERDKEALATQLIREVGVPPHLRGYLYIRQAILLVVEDNEMLRGITTRLYPKIAEVNKTIPTRVERAIRHAIEVAWTRGDIDAHHKLFGYTIQERKGKPTNGEFIAMLSDKVSMMLRQK